MAEFYVKTMGEMGSIAAADWDRCAGPENPFLSHAFLLSMEESGTACAETGWLPHHLGLFVEGDRLVGAVPLYVKSHSTGEFVFDYGWANAYENAGGVYYPKLQVAVPYTPVPGERLLLSPEAHPEAEKLLLQALRAVTDQLGLSSVHVTFCPGRTFEMAPEPWLKRTGLQFHWHNRGYKTFQDFLDTLSARKRKDIRKEREAVAKSGLELLALTGDDLKEEHWDAFFSFYMDTCSRKWGEAALTRKFFSQIHERMADKIVLMMARENGRYVAGALNLLGTKSLFGRNWGALGHYPFLHFELCYYQAIDFAIKHRLERVEAGAQGIHKVARGYEPVQTYSLHYVRDRGFRKVLEQVLERERVAIDQNQEEIGQHTPFRKGARSAEE